MRRRIVVAGLWLTTTALAVNVLAVEPSTEPSTASTTRPATHQGTQPASRRAVTTTASRPATTSATPGPATTQATAVVDPAAVETLNRLAATYAAAGPLHTAGDLVGHFDVAGRRRTYTLHVDGRTDGDGRFIHDAGPAGLVVSDGTDAYLYDRRRDAYATLDAAPGRAPAAEVDGSVISILLDENPALLLTLTDDPAGLLRRAAKTILLTGGPTTPAATTAAASPATTPAGLALGLLDKTVTLRLNASGDIISAVIDYTPLMTARHAVAVKAATVTLTYAPATHEPPPAGAFTWRPPESATEFDAGEDLLKPKPATRPATTSPAGTRRAATRPTSEPR